jgi:type VI secretion system protein ImpK
MKESQPAARALRTSSLALVFQEVITVIVRTRLSAQRVEHAEAFRGMLRKMISDATKQAAAIGYSDEACKMAIYAVIGFLDESVLNSKDPAFSDWARRPLQEEMFQGHFAGEYFFRNITDLLNRPQSPEVADVLELHAVCLQLGYRGRFAFGDATEIQVILRRVRDKISAIRGGPELFALAEAPPVPTQSARDPWVRRLAIAAVVLVFLTVVLYAGYFLLLQHGNAVPTGRTVDAQAGVAQEVPA